MMARSESPSWRSLKNVRSTRGETLRAIDILAGLTFHGISESLLRQGLDFKLDVNSLGLMLINNVGIWLVEYRLSVVVHRSERSREK